MKGVESFGEVGPVEGTFTMVGEMKDLRANFTRTLQRRVLRKLDAVSEETLSVLSKVTEILDYHGKRCSFV